jgi:indolepyruvate ferredoxin oxidoreductase beta subunit
MKKDIILAGVGGQGIVSIAAVIGFAALEEGLHMKQSEVHGMSQRGGDVMSNMRLSDKEIASDLIPFGKADLIISIEPMESLRYLPYLHKDGWIITSTKPFVNIPNYPDIDQIMKSVQSVPHYIALDADSIAKDIGSAKSTNIVVLGAAAPFLGIPVEKMENAIRFIFKKKGEDVTNLNLLALKAGVDFARSHMN